MAEAILFTGKRGEGKTKSAVRMIRDYLREGRIVATNLDINLEAMLPAFSDAVAYRLPDHPSPEDLEALPLGNPNPLDEKRNGLLVLDEVSTFLNSREWQKGDRAGFISWLAQSRKLGWDLVLIAQHPRMIDAQIRDSLFELHANCRRLDKMAVPMVSPVWQWLTGKPLRMPSLHIVTMRYGFAPGAPKALSWWYSGADLHSAYDTLQKISPITGQEGLSMFLSPWKTKGRYLSKVALYRGVGMAAFVLGALVGIAGAYGYSVVKPEDAPVAQVEKVDGKSFIAGIVSAGDRVQLLLTDGRSVRSEAAKMADGGVIHRAGGVWYREQP